MDPSRSVLMNAIVTAACLGMLAGVPPSAAQHEAELLALEYSPDPLARSPRLLAMGRLTLADDLHNRITLWDFAGNPTGIAEAESLSTLEYRPLLRTSAVVHDIPAGTGFRDRQELRARRMRHGIEAWRRAPGTTAYGLTAELATLQVDRPFGEGIERRGRFTVPAIGGAVNGRVPWLKSDRFDYALRLEYGRETHDDGYYEFLRLPQGDYLGHESAVVSPPDLFTPNRNEATNLRGGVAFSMRVTRSIKAAVGYDRARVRVRSTLEGLRSTSRVDVDRPVEIGQASLIGRLGRHLEWVADGRAWRSRSEEFFFWSVSAGPSTPPLVGSGKSLDRDDRGTSLRTRVRWTSGPFELGAGLGTQFRRTIDTPWYRQNSGDPTGFNDFLAEVGARPGADTLLLPQRIEHRRVEERALEISAGGTVQLPGRRGVLGAEVHRRRRAQESSVGGGPTPKGWEIRAGGEYRCSDTFLARAGWSYGVHDRDDLTSDDAYRGATATTGFGHRPAGSRWSVDIGYAYEWVRPDFVDPARTRGDDQHLAVQMRWQF